MTDAEAMIERLGQFCEPGIRLSHRLRVMREAQDFIRDDIQTRALDQAAIARIIEPESGPFENPGHWDRAMHKAQEIIELITKGKR